MPQNQKGLFTFVKPSILFFYLPSIFLLSDPMLSIHCTLLGLEHLKNEIRQNKAAFCSVNTAIKFLCPWVESPKSNSIQDLNNKIHRNSTKLWKFKYRLILPYSHVHKSDAACLPSLLSVSAELCCLKTIDLYLFIITTQTFSLSFCMKGQNRALFNSCSANTLHACSFDFCIH